jgi:phosphoribosylamine--glycine ligase
MRILVIDSCAASLDWTMRCQQAGHQVKWYVPPAEKTKYIGKGIVERVNDPREWAKWADIIFLTDNTKWLQEMDRWREKGWPVIGPTVAAAEWELNRGVGMEVLRKHGIEVPQSVVFNDYDKAIAYVRKTMKRFVSKPSGDADKALSYCSKSPADMIYMLERWKKLGKLKAPFILQEFIPGCEMAVGAWYGPGGFNQGWCENWEFKKLMNGDKGVATGEQGTVVRVVNKSLLADKVLKPLSSALEKVGHVGYVDVNCIIAEDGTPYPLEFTMRPGWPTFNIQQAIHKGDPAEWLLDLAEGKDAKNWELETIVLGVVMSIPDYPYSHLTRKEVAGIPLYGMTPSMRSFVHPCEMMAGSAPHQVGQSIVNKPCLVTAGDYVLVSTGKGSSILEAKKRAYGVIEKLSMPNSPMWRTDIGDRLKKQLPLLQSHGYAMGMNWK